MPTPNFIQTLYIAADKFLFQDCFGWASPQYHLMGRALSCLQLQKMYGKVQLYCNSQAADVLIGGMHLPYAEVHLIDNLQLKDNRLWALPKLHTYSLQSEPFIHADGDVFVFGRFSDNLLQGQLIAQNVEEASDYYTDFQAEIQKHFTFLPRCVAEDFASGQLIKAVNAGILGGHHIPFIQQYTKLAFEYIERNRKPLESVNAGMFNVFFEQHLFYSLTKEKNIPVSVLFDTVVKDNEYTHMADFHEAPCSKTYMHLIGQYKNDPFVCRQMAAKLRQLYPDYYYKIVALCKSKSTSLSVSLYNDNQLNKPEDYWKLYQDSTNKFCSKQKPEGKVALPKSKINDAGASIHKMRSVLQKATTLPGYQIHLEAINRDLQELTLAILKILSISYPVLDSKYIYGRDIAATDWYSSLFHNLVIVGECWVVKCECTIIVESCFDWGSVYNKFTRKGVKYYDELTLRPGVFFNLLTLEVFEEGPSLHDIDEMEKLLLDQLNNPILISGLIEKMKEYVDDDVIENHYDVYLQLIITSLKQLVLKKAIMPALASTETYEL